jgi:hypothetical protein
MKIKLTGRRFDIVEEIQAEMQIVLSTLTRKHFQDALQSGRISGINVCTPKGTTLKVMVQNKIQIRHNSFHEYISGIFG